MDDEPGTALARDRRLLAAWQAGDHSRGGELLELYQGYYVSLCHRYGVQREEDQLDLYQELLVRLLQALPGLELRSSFAGYLRRVFLTALRESRPRLEPALPGEQVLATEATVTPANDDRELLAVITECTEQLSERENHVFQERIFQERSHASIAAELEVSPGNLHVIYHRARTRMKDCLQRKGFRL